MLFMKVFIMGYNPAIIQNMKVRSTTNQSYSMFFES